MNTKRKTTSEKTPITENINELSIKDAFAADIETIKFRSTVIIDPAPMPFIPITPIVVGKKAFNYAKKIAASIKNVID